VSGMAIRKLTAVQADIHDFVATEFANEQRSAFARMRRIPDTRVVKFLEYFGDLSPSKQRALIDALARNALFYFFPASELGPNMYESENPAYRRYLDGIAKIEGFQYMNARSLKSLSSNYRNPRFRPLFPHLPRSLLSRAEAIEPLKAAETRKYVKKGLSQLFGFKVSNLGGGVWLYEGGIADSEIELEIDYAGSSAQLRYSICVRCSARSIVLGSYAAFNYEKLFGIAHGDWNYLTGQNIERSIELLGELITYIAELPRRLPDTYGQESNA
jgi:hypothetical protein